jgi:hypothetical protein
MNPDVTPAGAASSGLARGVRVWHRTWGLAGWVVRSAGPGTASGSVVVRFDGTGETESTCAPAELDLLPFDPLAPELPAADAPGEPWSPQLALDRLRAARSGEPAALAEVRELRGVMPEPE